MVSLRARAFAMLDYKWPPAIGGRMSGENKVLVKAIYEAFPNGDIDTIIGFMDDNVDWHIPGVSPLSGRHYGRDQVRQYLADLNRLVQFDEFDVDEMVAEASTVVATGRQRCTVRETGDRFGYDWAHVFKIRNGKVTVLRVYDDTYEAAAAFGQSRQERAALGGPLKPTHPPFSREWEPEPDTECKPGRHTGKH
jgi:ketosteroid isomerase-like protein